MENVVVDQKKSDFFGFWALIGFGVGIAGRCIVSF